MLKIYDKNHNAIGHIVKYRDCKIESDVSTGDKTLYFVYLARHHNIQNEMYVRTKEDEFVVKEVPATTGAFPQIVAALNLEDLQRDMWQTFSVTDATIDEAAATVLAGTGWTIAYCDVEKRRNAGMMQVSSLDVIQNLCKAFMCEPKFDTINKTVSFYKKRGEDRGVYFMTGLNLKKLQSQSTSYDFYTRIIPIGKNGLTIESVNDGKNYLDNFQYANKVITCIWKDESYTDAQALKEDAELKLADMSKPQKSFQADIRNLAAQKPEYSLLSYGEGDVIRLIDEETGTMESQRIVKIVRYPKDPEKDTCEIANTMLTFEEMQQKYQEAADIINMTVAGDGRYTGTINVSDILHFEEGINGSPTIGGINSSITSLQGEMGRIKLSVGQIETNYLKAEEAELKYVTIQKADIIEQNVHNLQGDYAAFKSTTTNELSANAALINKVSGDLASYKTIVADEFVAAKGWMAAGSIGEAQIADLSANKLKSGTLDTAAVTVMGSGGKLRIADNTLQIEDDDRVRVQIGKDAAGDYSMSVWDAEGNLIWDALGATENTIQRKIIRDKMVADDAAIQAMKIDYQNFETALTQQGVTISGTVIQVGSKTLNVALTEQTQKIEENNQKISTHETKITANEQAIALRVSAQDFDTFKTSVTDQMTTVNTKFSDVDTSIEALEGQIALKVEQTDIDTAISTVNSKFASYSTTSQMTAAITAAKGEVTTAVANTYAKKSELSTVSGKVISLETWKEEASQKITKDGIISIVGSYYAKQSDFSDVQAKLNSTETLASQTADKFNWIVKSGTSETDFTITDRMSELTAAYINLHGIVNISGISDAALRAIAAGSLEVKEITPVYGWMDTGQTILTDAGNDVYLAGALMLDFRPAEGNDSIWGYFQGKKVTIPSFTANLYKDNVPYKKGYFVYRTVASGGFSPQALLVWQRSSDTNPGWTCTPADGSGTHEPGYVYTWADETDIVLGTYTKSKEGITYQIYCPWKSHQDIKLETMVGNWAADAIGENTTINGGLIMTNSISADKLKVDEIFARDITARGTIRGATLIGGSFSTSNEGRTTKIYNASIEFYKGETKTGGISPIAWANDYENDEGIMYATESDYLSLAYKMQNGYTAAYVLNNGLNPDGITQRNIFYGSVYMDSSAYIGGILTLPPRRIGDGYDGAIHVGDGNASHLSIGSNQIVRKLSETEYGTLYLNSVNGVGGQVAIGNGGLYVNGKVSCTTLSQTSDERKKNIVYWEKEAYERFLMSISPIAFMWREGLDTAVHTGIGAQSVMRTMKECGLSNAGLVEYSAGDDSYSVAYSELHAIEIAVIQENRNRIIKMADDIFRNMGKTQDIDKRIDFLERGLRMAIAKLQEQKVLIMQLKSETQ